MKEEKFFKKLQENNVNSMGVTQHPTTNFTDGGRTRNDQTSCDIASEHKTIMLLVQVVFGLLLKCLYPL